MSPLGLSLFYPSVSILRTTESLTSGVSLTLDYSHCSFLQACKVYSLLTLQGFWLCSGSQSIMQL